MLDRFFFKGVYSAYRQHRSLVERGPLLRSPYSGSLSYLQRSSKLGRIDHLARRSAQKQLPVDERLG